MCRPDTHSLINVRGRFIIDPDGVIQVLEILTPAVGRNVMELILQVQAFQHVRTTGEEDTQTWVEPGWPGLGGLEPGHGLLIALDTDCA